MKNERRWHFLCVDFEEKKKVRDRKEERMKSNRKDKEYMSLLPLHISQRSVATYKAIK